MASASSVAGPSAPSTPSWGRGTGRRGPTRGVTERRLPDGQQWNVSLVRGYGVGPTTYIFMSPMGIVSKLYYKIWQKDFAKLPIATKELILRDIQLMYQWERIEKTDREMLAHMSAMHRSWRSKEKKRETMTQLMAPSLDVDAESHTPATPEETIISVMEKDRPGPVRCTGSGETLSRWYKSTGTSGSSERETIMQEQLKIQEQKLKA
ncbi:hypothetical protein Taro_010017 [Colocasia esculenta]|uniref:Uncharacterized protein n=1 Tax=Colocasia esculenta TaxID=4460 RepID=A0A843U2L6_COLES|nr:hypothetical protein [Colocasia esculenta]